MVAVPIKGGAAVTYVMKRLVGINPVAGLLRSGRTVYGMASFGGGSANAGSVFKITPEGRVVAVYRFQGGADGLGPDGALTKIDDSGLFYGTTGLGGTANSGTVFSVTASGDHAVLYSFQGGADGQSPTGSLVNVGGVFYGTTQYGGGTADCGTVFSITPAGVEHVLYSFQGGTTDGCEPNPLVAVGSTLYGTTMSGGVNGQDGTIFQVSLTGSEQLLYSFPSYSRPGAALTEMEGVLYGTTVVGGTYNSGTAFALTP